MGANKQDKGGDFRKRLLKRFPKQVRLDHEKSPSNGPSENFEASTDSANDQSVPPATPESVLVPSPEQSRQNYSHTGLWARAADSLDPGDREKLEKLVRSKRECPNGHGPDILADEVNSTLFRAEKLKDENKEVTWRPVSPLCSQNSN